MAAAGASVVVVSSARASARGGEGDDARRGSKAWVTSLAGAIAGASARVCVAPLDVVKISPQVQPEAGAAGKYRGLTHAVSTILREEGVRAMWAGTTPALLLWVPYTAIQFTVLNAFKDAMDEWNARGPIDGGVPMNHRWRRRRVGGNGGDVPVRRHTNVARESGPPKGVQGHSRRRRGRRARTRRRAACTRASR